MSHPLETEVKLPVADLGAVRQCLLGLGFQTAIAAQPERSVLWDQGTLLLDQGCALRLRRYASAVRLTWKGARVEDPRFKIRPELETGIEDGEVMEAILTQLGFTPVLAMEKRREVLERPGLSACLDETPFGTYLELEGETGAIREALRELGMEEAPAETRSYPALYRAHGLG